MKHHGNRVFAAFMESFMNSITDAVVIYSPDHRVIRVNRAFESMFGWTGKEVLGQGVETNPFFPDDKRDEGRSFLEQIQKGAPLPLIHTQRKRKDGALIDVSVSIAPILSRGGRLVALSSIHRDITELKYIRKALNHSNDRYKKLVQFSPDTILVLTEGIVVYVNPAGVKLLKAESIADLLGKSMMELTPPDYKDQTIRLINKIGYETETGEPCEGKLVALDGAESDVEMTGVRIDYNEQESIQLVVRDITDRKMDERVFVAEREQYERRLKEMAFTDSLTGLPNRRVMKDRVTQALEHAKRDRHAVGLLFLDIDHFKSINDTMGHDVGDGLIVNFAERVKGSLRESDTLCRLGGDEFVVLLPNISSVDDVAASAKRIVRSLQIPWDIHGYSFSTTSSIGGALSDDADTVEFLLKKADKALYEAKEQGRNTFRVFKT